MNDEDKLYYEAMEAIRALVDGVLQTCQDVADQNDYEKEWVIDRFREQFNKVNKQQ